MSKERLNCVFPILSIAWAGFGLCHALRDFSIEDQKDGLIWLATGLFLFLIFIVASIFKRTRIAAALSLLILAISGVAEMGLRSHRRALGVKQLEVIYQRIAAEGAPFPLSIDRGTYENPGFVHWYYQRNSEQTFAVVYIISSDGWAMEYPGSEWRFVGYRPDGYEPSRTMHADGDSAALNHHR